MPTPTAGSASGSEFSETPADSVGWGNQGDRLAERGDLEGALAAYRSAHAAALETRAADDAALALERIAQVLARQGDSAGTRKALADMLAARRAHCEAASGAAPLAAALAGALERAADLVAGLGARGEAIQQLREALALRQDQAADGNEPARRALARCHGRLGDLCTAAGDAKAALQHAREAMILAISLAESRPADAVLSREVMVALARAGDALQATGDAEGAARHHAGALALAQHLCRSNPADATLQRDLMVSHVKMARSSPGDVTDHLVAALTIANDLMLRGALPPEDGWMIDDLERRMSKLAA